MNYRRRHLSPKIKKFKPKAPFFKKSGFWVFVVFSIFSVFFYLFLFLPNIQIAEIEVFGNEKASKADIENLAWSQIKKKIVNLGSASLYSKSILALNSQYTENLIVKELKEVKSAIVKKVFPDKLIITIEERKPFAVFCSQASECSFIDEQAVIFEELIEIPKNIVVLEGEREFFKGNKNIINLIDKIKESLEKNFGIASRKFYLSNPLIVETSEGWQAYFDINLSIDEQIQKLEAILKNEISESKRKNLDYIYLQYKDRAYFK